MAEPNLTVNEALFAMTMGELAKYAKPQEKSAFLPASDPSMAGGDPAAAGSMGGMPMSAGMPSGGGPPMDPAAAAGGAPPMDPAAAGGGGGVTIDQLRQVLGEFMRGGGAPGAGGAAAGPGQKPKIDVNQELHRLTMLMALVVDHLGIKVPSMAMVATGPEDQAMGGGASQTGAAGGAAGGTPGAGGSAVPPMDTMQPMPAAQAPAPAAPGGGGGEKKSSDNGEAFRVEGLAQLGDRADAIRRIMDAYANKAA